MNKVAQVLLWQAEAWHAPALQPEVADELARQVLTLCESILTFADVAPFEAEPADFTRVLSSSGSQRDAKDG